MRVHLPALMVQTANIFKFALRTVAVAATATVLHGNAVLSKEECMRMHVGAGVLAGS